AAIVFLGPTGLGPWQLLDISAAVDLMVRGQLKPLVATLPRTDAATLPPIPRALKYVRFSNRRDEDTLSRLVAAIARAPGQRGTPAVFTVNGVAPPAGALEEAIGKISRVLLGNTRSNVTFFVGSGVIPRDPIYP